MSCSAEIRHALEEARANTLRLFQHVDAADFRRQAHREFSPVGWHLGHVGVTESYWILQQCKGEPTLSAAYDHFFTPTDNPKPNRARLPAREEVLAYLHAVRERVLAFLERVDFDSAHPLLRGANIFRMLIQHEEQHNETILLLLQMLTADRYDNQTQAGEKRSQLQGPITLPRLSPSPFSPSPGTGEGRGEGLFVQGDMALVPAGPFLMGSNQEAETLDNERPQHVVSVGAFLVDRYPVANQEFLHFVGSGGYRHRPWWSAEGWQWRRQNGIEHPLYWRERQRGEWVEVGLEQVRPLEPQSPVMGISWYEAEAYARFAGKRLPTEAEWEKAASWGCLEKSGNVWEWTSTWFHPYPGFVAYPYEGYSVPYFDQRHRVLKGGSWATRRHILRATFRNWYHPWVREIFAGFRCAQQP